MKLILKQRPPFPVSHRVLFADFLSEYLFADVRESCSVFGMQFLEYYVNVHRFALDSPTESQKLCYLSVEIRSERMANDSDFGVRKECFHLWESVLRPFEVKRIKDEDLFLGGNLNGREDVHRTVEGRTGHSALSIYAYQSALGNSVDALVNIRLVDPNYIRLVVSEIPQRKIFLSIRWCEFVILQSIWDTVEYVFYLFLDLMR